jgi:hypothetical protein
VHIAVPKVVVALAGGIFIWTGDDTCGNGGHWVFPGHGPGPGPGPQPFHLAIDSKTMQSLPVKQQEALMRYIEEYPAVAAEGLHAMTRVLNVLKATSDILASARKKID